MKAMIATSMTTGGMNRRAMVPGRGDPDHGAPLWVGEPVGEELGGAHGGVSPSSQTQGRSIASRAMRATAESGLGGPGDLGVEFEFVPELVHDVGLLLGVSISMPVERDLAPVVGGVGRLPARFPPGFLPALSLPQPP